VTTSFILALADKGWRRALNDDPHLRNGLNVHDGRITYRADPRPKGREFLFC
jgi:alanine dehydrogenase